MTRLHPLTNAWARLPDPFFIEIFSAGTAFAWGAWMFTHPEVLMKSRLYDALEQAIPYPYVVGSVAMLVGVGQALMTFRRGITGRWAGAFCAGSFFFLIMNALQRADDTMPGLVMYSSFAAMNLLTMGLLFRRRKLP